MEIGSKIKRLRVSQNLTQEELAERCELTKGFISQVERDLTSPSIATLMDILEALGTDISAFFSADKNIQYKFTKDDFFTTENDELGYKISWIVPNAQKNDMEPILIELLPGGRSRLIQPFEGQEFGYILDGSVNLVIDGITTKLSKSDTFYFDARREHYIENKSKRVARILWVSNPPNF